MSWSVKSIDDITEVVTKGTTPSTYGMPFTDEGINFVKAEALNGDVTLDRSGFTFINDETHEKLKRSKLQQDDVLVTIAGANVGKCGYVRPSDVPANTNQAVGIVRVKKEEANPRYIYYHFKNPSTFAMCQGIGGGQAAQPNINLTMLKGFKVNMPDLESQNRIVGVIGAYDDLIENNKRRIELLEESARQLYKEWFVRFRFPGHEHVKIIDGVPEGWEKKPFSSVAEFLNGFAFKPAHFEESGLPIVKIPELKNGVLDKTPRNSGEDIPIQLHLDDGDLLFSWSGTLAVNIWFSGQALLNQHLFKVNPIDRVSRAFLLIALKDSMPHFVNETTGATMKHIRRSALDKVAVLLPNEALLGEFEDVAMNCYAQVLSLHKANIALAAARDLLLPKLMNGEIAV